MKAYCNTCGCHFPKEFEHTLLPKCNWWGDRGAANIPVEWKRVVWDWQFSVDTDKFYLETGMSLQLQLGFVPVEATNTFAAMVDGWDKMTEEERQAYEKEHFKKVWREGKKVSISNVDQIDLTKLTEEQIYKFQELLLTEYKKRHEQQKN